MNQDEMKHEDANLSYEIENEILGQLGANGDQIDIEKLGKVYEITKAQEREDRNSERELKLREEELKQNKKRNVIDIVSKIGLGVLFAGLTLVTQKKDQEFQKEGFGYDNETSKRSSNVLSSFKNIL